MRRVLLFVVAFAINAPPSALAQSTDALPNDNQHYGEIADPPVWPISAVGVVTVALFNRKMYCTGTLVAPKLDSQPRTVCSTGNCWSIQGMSDF